MPIIKGKKFPEKLSLFGCSVLQQANRRLKVVGLVLTSAIVGVPHCGNPSQGNHGGLPLPIMTKIEIKLKLVFKIQGRINRSVPAMRYYFNSIPRSFAASAI